MKIDYELSAEVDDTPIKGNAMASGDPEADRETEQWICRELDRGNVWAWCQVTVTASIELDGETYIGRDTLGGCSYQSEKDFRENAYFDDMRDRAKVDLIERIKSAIERGEVAKKVLKELKYE